MSVFFGERVETLDRKYTGILHVEFNPCFDLIFYGFKMSKNSGHKIILFFSENHNL